MQKIEGSNSLSEATGKDKKTILVVDDEFENRNIFSELLNDLGYKVIDKPDGASALTTIQRGAKIDLVITDERMPNMSGLELIETLRTVVPSLQVILITAHGSIEDYLHSSSLGVSEYIQRPVGKKELGKIIKTALRHNEIQ